MSKTTPSHPGLSDELARNALTLEVAKYLGCYRRVHVGKSAQIVVTVAGLQHCFFEHCFGRKSGSRNLSRKPGWAAYGPVIGADQNDSYHVIAGGQLLKPEPRVRCNY